MDRPLKKTETLEIRLPHQTKQAFMARCREDGVSASEAIRGFIADRLEARRPAASADRRGRLQLAAGLAAALGLAASAAPSLAGSFDRIGFERLDRDGSGALSLAELAHGARLEVRLEASGLEVGRAEAEPAGALFDALLRRKFAGLDADGNGALSFGEFRGR